MEDSDVYRPISMVRIEPYFGQAPTSQRFVEYDDSLPDHIGRTDPVPVGLSRHEKKKRRRLT